MDSTTAEAAAASASAATAANFSLPQTVLLDLFFPGFSVLAATIQRYLHVDLNLYIPLVLLIGGLTFLWRYFSDYVWDVTESYLMSVVDIRTDDEIYNMLMSWVAAQRFAQSARRFVVNTNLSSRSWWPGRWSDEYDDDYAEENEDDTGGRKKKKALAYTPTFGSHWFWYKGHLLIFRRTQNRDQGSGFLSASEKEEISISCFGRNPWVLKELLHEARETYIKRDEAKTLIYRGTTKSGSTEPNWQRCMARTTRPLSTVILDEKQKTALIEDVTDYLDPSTRRWYSNRGIPYRRGYLLYGPPGTGKSSLSLALAGFFKMRIYIVSLSSVTASEENLATLFAELPRRCVVLLEDIDTAGLTHTRAEDGSTPAAGASSGDDMLPGQTSPGTTSGNDRSGSGGANNAVVPPIGRLSLSGLLNILDGVASQEGRVLIMTTNHLEKLDKALIRPGRVDMIVEFGRADAQMTAAIFRAIFAPLEGDEAPSVTSVDPTISTNEKFPIGSPEAEKKRAEELAAAKRKREETVAKVEKLADEFAARIPAHEFSPAEIQGFLLKHKRAPEKAVEGAAEWVVEARKEKKEKEIREAKEKREKEEKEKKEKEEEEKKKKEEEEKEKKEKKVKKKSKKEKKPKSSSHRKRDSSGSESESSSSSGSGSSSESGSEAESEAEKRRSAKKEKKAKKHRSGSSKSGGEEEKAKSEAVVLTPATSPVEKSAVLAPGVDSIPAIKVAKASEVEDPAVMTPNEAKHGGDSGYGTP